MNYGTHCKKRSPCRSTTVEYFVKIWAHQFQIIYPFNPFPPSVPIWHRLVKLSILIEEGIIKKISYERRDYESVDEKSLS